MKKEILLETGTNEFEILEFYIEEFSKLTNTNEHNKYGINVAKVTEVIQSPLLTHSLNSVNKCYLGLISLRGEMLPVLDLAEWLGITKTTKPNEVIIVTKFSKIFTGFLVSGVVEIHRISWQDVESPSTIFKHLPSNCIIGNTIINNNFIQLLDLEFIVSDLSLEIIEHLEPSVISEFQYKAVIADDSRLIRKMLTGTLTAANFEVKEFVNGSDAHSYLERLASKASSENIDLSNLVNIVISDIEMPQMDGFSLTKKIKSNDILKQIPVILYSSIITPELRHKGESVKADEQVAKPDLNMIPEISLKLIKKYMSLTENSKPNPNVTF